MSAAVRALGVLDSAVHVLDPETSAPLVLAPGEEVTDPGVAQQITNPRCWRGGETPRQPTASKNGRKSKPAEG